MNSLKESIVKDMGSTSEFTADDGTVAKLVDKVTYKYTNEDAMVNWCKANGHSDLVKEKIDTTSMNKELKKGGVLTESLNSLYNRTVSTSLTVEKK